jgi:hypothetical protein
MNEDDNKTSMERELQNPPTVERNSAYIPGNPDFHPSKDVPQARGCDTMADIISSQY